MPNCVSQAMDIAGPSSYHNNFHQDVHVYENLTQAGMGQPLVELCDYPNQQVVEEGIDYLVDVVFVKDPFSFFCQLVGSLPCFNALMGRLATVYSGKELNCTGFIFNLNLNFPFC